MTTAVSLVVEEGKMKGPDLCAMLHTGALPVSGRAVCDLHGPRMWQSRKTAVPDKFRDANKVMAEGVAHLIGETDFMLKFDDARFDILKRVLNAHQLSIQKIDEFYEKFRNSGDCDVSRLFRKNKSLLSWKKIDGHEGKSRLVADVAKIVAGNKNLFGCSDTNEARYIKSVVNSDVFKQRWARLYVDAERRSDGALVPMMKNTTMDLMAFQLFVRCCDGPASDLTVAEDALTAAFVGFGDMREIARLLWQARSSDASLEEQESCGVNKESQERGLRELQTQISNLESDIEALKLNAIPESERLFVGAFLDEKRFDYGEDRMRFLKLFGSFVTQTLNSKGLSDTIAREQTDFGARNVYDKRKHLFVFEDCFERFPEHIAKASAGSIVRTPTPYEWYRRAIESDSQREWLFRDVNDSKLADVGVDSTRREAVLAEREKALWWLFRDSVDILRRALRKDDVYDEAYETSKKQYNVNRVNKLERAVQRQRARDEREARKQAAQRRREVQAEERERRRRRV